MLKEKLITSHIAFENEVDVDSYAHDVRCEALKQFETVGFPSKKEEAYKYTSLASRLKRDYSLFPQRKRDISFDEVKKYYIQDINAYNLVFVDGKFNAHLSDTTHDGLDVCLLSSALDKPKYKAVIEAYFNKIAGKDGLNSINTAYAKEGAFIHVPRNKQIEKPVQIIYFATGDEKALMLQPRNLVVVEENAQVQIIERHQSLADNDVFTNVVTEVFVEKRAMVDYYKIQNDRRNATLVDSTWIQQQRESVASVHTFSFGGSLTRNNLNFYQQGEHIDSTLNGITIIEGKQHVDHNTLVHHQQPNCESHQDYKGIFSDTATGVFNGKVLVDKIAQKTNAFQQNNNIIVDDKATVNAKPQLEIFADDVRCSHGCTIGQLDEDALFYLRSRGIGKKEATALLMYAFSNSVLDSVKIPEIKSRINKQIALKLGVKLGFTV